MKKSKSFTQFKGNGFAISVCINNIGTLINESILVLYGEKRTEYNKQYNEDNKEKRTEYRKNNKEKIKLYKKQYNIDNKEAIKCYNKQYYVDNKEELNIRNKQYYVDNKESINFQHKQYCKENTEKIYIRSRQYYKDNPERIRRYRNKSEAKRRGWGTPNSINKYFKNSHLHHLHLNNDHRIAIYIPTDLHKSVWHTYNRPETMAIINTLVFEWLATQDIII